MENNNLPAATENNIVPDAASAAQNNAPSVDATGSMPSNPYAPAAQPSPNAAYMPPAQPAGYAPNANYGQPAPAANVYAYTPGYSISKTGSGQWSVGKILALIFGIILALGGGFLTLCLVVADASTGFTDVVIPAYVVVAIPLILGIVLIVLGEKKKKEPVLLNAAYAPPYNQGYAVPAAQNNANTGYAAPVASPAPNTAPVQGQPAAQDTAAGMPTIAQAVSTATSAIPQGTNPAGNAVGMNYQYSPTAFIEDESKKLAKKNARRSALLALGVLVLMWIIAFFGWISWYLLILPFILAFNALRSNIKSILGWLAMILSALSAVLVVVLLFVH